ncbi:MAG: cupredoxin domain-containing protein [Allosphingosinicella sp.]
MRRFGLFLGALATTAPAAPAAAQQEWRLAPEYDVLVTSFEIQPRVIHLKAGEPVRLHFVNNSEQPHRFYAPAFFRSAELRGRDRGLIRGGGLDVAPLSEATIAFVPRKGRYSVKGDNLLRRVIGMTARIVVE